MAATTDSFVDVTYLGLELGRRVKLTEVEPDSGYLEIAAPMPVGTALELRIEPDGDGGGAAIAIAAIVRGVHEQVGGSDRAPGMRVEPALAGAAQAWWTARARPKPPGGRPTHRMTALEAEETKAIAEQMLRTSAGAPVTTAPAAPAIAIVEQVADDDGPGDDGLVDDGKRTAVMAVPPVMDDDGDDADDDDAGNGNGETSGEIEIPDASPSASGKLPAARGKGKRKRRKR